MRRITILNDVTEATGLLTRLPVTLQHTPRGAPAAWAYPLVGVCVAAMAGSLGLLAAILGLPPLAAALVALLIQTLLTGALHEDGLADWADALGARGGPAERLAVMKDSRSGVFANLALIFSVALRASAVAALAPAFILPMIAAASVSRAAMVLPMALLPHAREDGLARLTGRPAAPIAVIALAIGLAAALITCGWPGLVAALIALSASALPALWARHNIGGQTGDILGASQQCAEVTALLALAALIP